MQTNEKFQILRAFRPYLTLLTLYNWENFHGQTARVFTRSICRAIGMTVAFIAYLLLFLSSELLVCIRENFNLNVIAQPFAFFLGGSQAMFIYFLLSWKSHKFIETLDHLQQIVEKRMFRSTILIFLLMEYSLHNLFYSGCSLSKELLDNYEENERRHTRITWTMVKVILSIIFALFSLSSTFPITYAIFDYPPPSQWALPFDYQ